MKLLPARPNTIITAIVIPKNITAFEEEESSSEAFYLKFNCYWLEIDIYTAGGAWLSELTSYV